MWRFVHGLCASPYVTSVLSCDVLAWAWSLESILSVITCVANTCVGEGIMLAKASTIREPTEQTQTKAQPNTNTSWIAHETKHRPTVLYVYLMAVCASVFALKITAFQKACECMRATPHQKHDKKKVSDRPFIFKCDPIFSDFQRNDSKIVLLPDN